MRLDASPETGLLAIMVEGMRCLKQMPPPTFGDRSSANLRSSHEWHRA